MEEEILVHQAEVLPSAAQPVRIGKKNKKRKSAECENTLEDYYSMLTSQPNLVSADQSFEKVLGKEPVVFSKNQGETSQWSLKISILFSFH